MTSASSFLHWSRHVLYCLANLNHAKTFFDHFTGELSGLPWIKSDLLQIKPRRYASQIILDSLKVDHVAFSQCQQSIRMVLPVQGAIAVKHFQDAILRSVIPSVHMPSFIVTMWREDSYKRRYVDLAGKVNADITWPAFQLF